MIVKLLAPQIPTFWETIKYAVKHADGVKDRELPSYLTELLHALLNDKAQCWVRLSDKRELYALCITRIMHNPQRDEKYLYVQALYSWQPQQDEIWQRDWGFIKSFAAKEQCKYIGCMSSNRRAFEIYEALGMEEQARIFSVEIGV